MVISDLGCSCIGRIFILIGNISLLGGCLWCRFLVVNLFRGQFAMLFGYRFRLLLLGGPLVLLLGLCRLLFCTTVGRRAFTSAVG